MVECLSWTIGSCHEAHRSCPALFFLLVSSERFLTLRYLHQTGTFIYLAMRAACLVLLMYNGVNTRTHYSVCCFVWHAWHRTSWSRRFLVGCCFRSEPADWLSWILNEVHSSCRYSGPSDGAMISSSFCPIHIRQLSCHSNCTGYCKTRSIRHTRSK